MNNTLAPLTETQTRNIVRNVCAACQKITKLNKTGYQFLSLASGFIAHYSLYGFIDHYGDAGPGTLAQAILRNQSRNQWQNFRPGERNYEYYMSKKTTYNQICDRLKLLDELRTLA